MRISCCHHIYNQACEINKYKNSLERKCQRKNIFLAFKDLAKEKNIFRTWLGGVSRNRNKSSSSDIGFVLESFNGVGNQVGLTSGRKLYVDKNRGNVSYVDDTLVVAPFFVDTLLEITNITMMKQQWI